MFLHKISHRHIPAFILMLCIANVCNAQKVSASDSSAVFSLYELIIHRLEIMPQVAAAKNVTGLPITDTVRERKVIDQFRAAAVAKGLEPEAAALFIQWQIQLANKIQRQLIDEWRNGVNVNPRAEYTLVQLRMKLDSIGEQMINQLAICAPIFTKGHLINPPSLLKSQLKIFVTNRKERIALYGILKKQQIVAQKK